MSTTFIMDHNENKEMDFDPDILRQNTVEGKWEEVVIPMYQTYKAARNMVINSSRGTALHLAVNDRQTTYVELLVKAIIKHESEGEDDGVKALEMTDERGDTPLHLAASRGFKSICKCIIGEKHDRKHLLKVRNNQGETPLFQAALTWKKLAFAYLCHVYKDYINLGDLIRNDGDSILHCAIRREFFDLAFIIIRCYPGLINIPNNEGFNPFKVLATRPSAFMSGTNISWWKKILYHCITVQKLDVEKTIQIYLEKEDEPEEHDQKLPPNYQTCYDFGKLSHIDVKYVPYVVKGCFGMNDRQRQIPQGQLVPSDYETGCQIATSLSEDQCVPPAYDSFYEFLKFAYVHTLGLTGAGIKEIRKIKKKHTWGAQLLSAFMEKPYESYMGGGIQPDEQERDFISVFKKNHGGELKESETGTTQDTNEKKVDKKETAFLTAARNGIVEMVNELQEKIPSALHDTTIDKKNVLLVAVANRQPLVVEALRKRLGKKKEKGKAVWENLIQEVDNQENTVLHLAANTQSDGKDWHIAGAALQMMWYIKWFQYIKVLAPHHFNFRNNKDEKTAGEIFKESHKDLVKEGSEWLKDTSESCSVVAALNAGISFATASTVPGGNNEESGKPALEGQPAFDAFAMASLIGLCFSVTALIMFLSILTSRKQAKDFRRNLPLKMLLGLSSLFISIAAMFTSFCAGHFFVVRDKYKEIMFPIYAATCLPVTFYAIAQFPLYVDLLIAIVTKVPQPSDKGDDL